MWRIQCANGGGNRRGGIHVWKNLGWMEWVLGWRGGGRAFPIFLVLVHVHECIERLGSLVFGKFFGLTGDFFSIYRGGGSGLGRCWAWGNCERVTDSLHCNFDDLYWSVELHFLTWKGSPVISIMTRECWLNKPNTFYSHS